MTDARPRFVAALTAAAFFVIVVVAAAATAGAQEPTPDAVGVTRVDGAITPVIADHLADVVAQAETRRLQAVVVTLDTPGGLVTAMRDIVQTFLNAPVPVVVYVSPAGADAGSAGTFVTLAAHVAVMAPATTIGAATPVDIQGGEVGDKIVNNAAAYAEAIAEARGRNVAFAVDSVREGRSITSTEALDIGAIDLIEPDLDALLADVDGRQIPLAGSTVTLRTAGAPQVDLAMSWTRQALQKLADPNLAFLLLSLATLAILYEIASPGVGAGGVTGAVSLILGLYALSVLPVAWAGFALVIVAGVLFAVEVAAPGIGVAAAGGTVALLLAGLFLFQRPTGIGVDLSVLIPTVVVTAGIVVLIGVAAARTRSLTVTTGSDALIGRSARARVSGDRLTVQLDGTFWRIRPADPAIRLDDGDDVRVVARDNLDLLVVPEPQPTKEPS